MNRRPLAARAVLGAAAVGAAGLGALAYRRHTAPPLVPVPEPTLPGRPVALRSPDGTTLAAHVVAPASARAAVVFVHGWTMGSRFWHHQLEAMEADGLHVVAYDQRGHGASGRPAGNDHSCEALAADLDTVVDELVPAHLPLLAVGHSMGAMSVLAWATHARARALDRLGAAVLTNTGVHQLLPEVESLFPTRLPEPIVTRMMTAPVPLPPRSTPASRALVRQVAHGPDASDEAVALTEDLFLACPPTVRAGFGRTLANLDLRHAVGRLHVPTLVIGAEHDRLTPIRHARQLAADLPEAELVELARSGHQSPLELPGPVNDLIRHHLQRTLSVAA